MINSRKVKDEEEKEMTQVQKPIAGNRFGRPISEDTFKRKVTDEDMKKLLSEGDEDE